MPNPAWGNDMNGGYIDESENTPPFISDGFYRIGKFKIPDYLKDAYKRANSPSLKSNRLSAATTPATLSALVENRNNRTNINSTGLSGGFQKSFMNDNNLSSALKIESIFSKENYKFEQERIGMEAQIEQLKQDWASRQLNMKTMELNSKLLKDREEDQSSIASQLFNLIGL